MINLLATIFLTILSIGGNPTIDIFMKNFKAFLSTYSPSTGMSYNSYVSNINNFQPSDLDYIAQNYSDLYSAYIIPNITTNQSLMNYAVSKLNDADLETAMNNLGYSAFSAPTANFTNPLFAQALSPAQVTTLATSSTTSWLFPAEILPNLSSQQIHQSLTAIQANGGVANHFPQYTSAQQVRLAPYLSNNQISAMVYSTALSTNNWGILKALSPNQIANAGNTLLQTVPYTSYDLKVIKNFGNALNQLYPGEDFTKQFSAAASAIPTPKELTASVDITLTSPQAPLIQNPEASTFTPRPSGSRAFKALE